MSHRKFFTHFAVQNWIFFGFFFAAAMNRIFDSHIHSEKQMQKKKRNNKTL